MIDGIKVNVLAKVGLDASNSHVKQRFQEFVLVPFHGFIIGKINGSRIVEGREIGTLRCLFLQQRSDIRAPVICLKENGLTIRTERYMKEAIKT